ncbi:MAG: transglutaminase domain-containing protein [Methanotrichaceae archaeon]
MSLLVVAAPDQVNRSIVHVSICQVELNPPGDDQGREWVKLFNAGEYEIDIGGWILSAAHNGTQRVPLGTIIPSNGFYLVKSDDLWLENRDESITLRIESSQMIDATPVLNDSRNDYCIWSSLSQDCTEIVSEWIYINRYHQIDQHALNAPKWANESVKTLAAYLTEPAQNDEEKARAIYRWITANIDYDTKGYFVESYNYSSPEDMIKEGKAVCGGYGNLFQHLCNATGLECAEICGYGKGYGYQVGSEFTGPSNHAWNAIKIDGKWQLVDSTWGAGYINDEKQFVRQFDDYYFLTPPEEFVYTHLPEETRWQLLEDPLSKEEYEQLVYLKPPFFKNEMELTSRAQAVIRTEDQANISIFAPEDVLILVDLLDEKDQKLPDHFTFVQREDDPYVVRAVFPNPENYTLRIFSKRNEDPGKYNWTLDYNIEAGPGAISQTGFPQTYEIFQKQNARLYSPFEDRLKAGTSQIFKLKVPEAEDVAVINEGNWTHLAKEGNLFQGKIVLIKGNVLVSAKFPEDKYYYGMLEYNVI